MPARYREALSLVIGVAGLVLLGVGMDRLLNTGSCTSGGPYISTRTCSDNEMMWSVLLPIGLVVWIAGLMISRNGLVKPGAGQLLWSLGFAGLGTAVLVKALAQDAMPADARLGAYIMGGVFIPIGLVPGIGGLLQFINGRDEARRGKRPAAARETTWKRLLELRSTGAVSGAEFDRIQPDLETPGVEILLTELERLSAERAGGELTQEEFFARKRAALGLPSMTDSD